MEVWGGSGPAGTQQRRDADGEEAVVQLATALRSAEGGPRHFVDADFPASDASLYRGGGGEGGRAGAEDQEAGFRTDLAPFLAGVKDIQWKRPSEMGEAGSCRPVVFSADISPDDIAQGQLGNCYFLAALAACASAKDDRLLNDLIVEDGHDVGLYGVKFWVNGRWVTVVVDDRFPCTRDGRTGCWEPIFARSKAHDGSDALAERELWVLIMEKAWAKLHGSYEATASGWTEDALNYLCGGSASALELGQDVDGWDALLALVRRGREGGEERQAFLSCAVRPELGADPAQAARLQQLGLCTGHAYTVLDAVELPLPEQTEEGRGGGGGGAAGAKVVQLRNPWGTCVMTRPAPSLRHWLCPP
eukprot:COSAG01_NODE_10824_length_2073_cov_2.612969_1_plen_361_part_00